MAEDEVQNRKGRTREILAIIGGLGGLGVISYIALTSQNDTALGALISIVSGIFSFYFGAKTAEVR